MVNTKHISQVVIQGHKTYQHDVAIEQLKSTGSCFIKGDLQAVNVISRGILKAQDIKVQQIESDGLIKAHKLETTVLKHRGNLHIQQIEAKHFTLLLSGTSAIQTLQAEIIHIKPMWTLFKQCHCNAIIGQEVILEAVKANTVHADVIRIGAKCKIDKVYYKKSYHIHPMAKVGEVIEVY